MTTVKGLDLAGVVRVSTARQADAYGPEAQRTDMRAFARESGNRVHFKSPSGVVYQDTAGSDMDDLESREGLREALSDVQSHRMSGVLFGRLDRLSRDVILQETVLRDVLSWGGVLLSTSHAENEMLTDDDADPSREMIRVILSAVNRYEKKMIKLRMRNGRATKARNGGFAYGSPPFGWRASDGSLVPDDGEQKILIQMQAWRADGESYREIMNRLNLAGIPSKRGGKWYPDTVSSALRREVISDGEA